MIRNEYRRAFIMLRSDAPGYGGHARLERRATAGSLYFVVSAPEDAGGLEAAFAGRRNGEYFAAPIGALRRDRRGQMTLALRFDPRNIAGRPLEAYQWLAVARTDGACAVVLTGNVDGSRELDPAALQDAVCALYGPAEAPAADLPEPDETIPESSSVRDAPQPGEASATEAEAAPDSPATERAEATPEAAAEESSDVKVYVPSKARIFTAMCAPERDAAQSEPETAETAPESGDPETAEAESAGADAPSPEPTAAQALGLDAGAAWPGALEPLRPLFAAQSPAAGAPDDGYTYVRAPMPSASGFECCYIGLRAEGGQAAGIRYALPGRYAPEPPAGMDGYSWTGNGAEGFWTTTVSVES